MAGNLRIVDSVAERIHFAIGISPIGHVLTAQSADGICAVYLGKRPAQLIASLQKQFPHASCINDSHAVKSTLAEVIELIHQPQKTHQFALDLRGSDFQKQVWQALREIPVGSTASYSDIADKLHNSGAVRAVGSACAANNIAVIIPCHRVIRKDGLLSGYRWGLESKRALLQREGAIVRK